MNEYERASKEIIPAARAAMIKALSEKHSMNESTIARALGITQAAISKHLAKKYSNTIKELEGKVDPNLVTAYAEKIVAGNKEAVNEYICITCSALNRFDCSFAKINRSA